jgi:hypothetical protein
VDIEDDQSDARNTRPRRHRDDMILSAWNGLMIGAFARASRCDAASRVPLLRPSSSPRQSVLPQPLESVMRDVLVAALWLDAAHQLVVEHEADTRLTP